MYALAAAATPSPTALTAIAALREHPCWSHELQRCVETGKPSTVSGCATIRAGYKTEADAAAVDAAVEAMPFCSEPLEPAWLVVAAAGGFLAGALFVAAMKRG